MKTKGFYFDPEGCHYSFVSNEETNNSSVRLFHSRYGEWTDKCKGKLAARLLDDGNGVDLTLNGKQARLNYSELFELNLLLSEYSTTTGWPKPYPRSLKSTCDHPDCKAKH